MQDISQSILLFWNHIFILFTTEIFSSSSFSVSERNIGIFKQEFSKHAIILRRLRVGKPIWRLFGWQVFDGKAGTTISLSKLLFLFWKKTWCIEREVYWNLDFSPMVAQNSFADERIGVCILVFKFTR